MTLGRASNDKFRAATSTMTAAGSTARIKCRGCGETQSKGQYPVGRDICITCKPMPKGWRRGDLTIIGEFK